MKINLSLLLLVVVLCGCKGIGYTVKPGSDPVIVHAEQIQEQAIYEIDKFLLWEFTNRAAINDPGIKVFADTFRKNVPQWHDQVTLAIRAYKANRTPEARDGVAIALSVLQVAAQQAQAYLLTKGVK